MARAAQKVDVDTSVPMDPATVPARYYLPDGMHLNSDGAVMFTNLQLQAVMTSGRRQDISFGNYLGLRLLTTLLAFPVVFAITRILGYDRALTAAVLMVGLAYSIETISDIYWARLQLHDG